MAIPSPTEKNVYIVGCETEDDWVYIHDALEHDDWVVDDEVPTEHCDCVNDKQVGHTRGKFLLTDAEAEMLRQHPKVEYVHYDDDEYREYFHIPEEETLFDPEYGQRFNWRWENNVLVERANNTQNNFNQANHPFQQNKSGWNILRPAAKRDLWHYVHEQAGYPNSDSSYSSLSARVARTTTGEDVDLIAVDTGTWHAHPEFINDMPGIEYPRGYKGGNPLNPTGRSAVLDLILHGPYYIDPDWFDAEPELRLTTRWDGTIIPTQDAMIEWWKDSDERSAAFANVGTVIVGDYAESTCCGDIYGHSLASYHGTAVASQMYGRTHGWAYNANKWSVRFSALSYTSLFDAITIFHQNKPVNPKYGNRNPTVCNHSWGIVNTEMNSTANNRSGYTWYRPQYASITYTGDAWSISSTGSHSSAANPSSTNTSNTKPKWFRSLGYYGANWGFPVEMLSNSTLTAAANCVNAGVISVCAAANSNQKMVFSNHEDYNNHFSVDNDSTKRFTSNTYTSYGRTYYRSTNRLGFPGQAGRYYDSSAGHYKYKSIIIGALYDQWSTFGGTDYKEFKVSYSNMGEVVDVYSAAHDTIAATSDNTYGILRADVPNFYEANTVGVKTSVNASVINHVRGHTVSLTSLGGDANAHVEYGLQNPSQWIDVLGNCPSSRLEDEFKTIGHNDSGMRVGRKKIIVWKPQSGHRFVTSGSLNYPEIQHTDIPSSIRGVNAGIVSLTPSPMDGNYASQSSYDCWKIDLPFNIEYCGYTTSVIGISKWGVLEIGGQGSYGNYTTTASTIAHGFIPDYGQICINHGPCSAYTGIRTEVLGTAPNRQYWVRYASRYGSSSYTSGDMTTAWEATFFENSNALEIQVDINTLLQETAQTVSNDYFRDRFFSGTSSASPVSAGIIGTKMEVNRTWTYSDVKNWITTKVGTQPSNEFYYGSEAPSGSDTQNDDAWEDINGLSGSNPIIMWNAPTDNDPPIEKNMNIDIGKNLNIDGGGNLTIRYDNES